MKKNEQKRAAILQHGEYIMCQKKKKVNKYRKKKKNYL